MGIKAKRLGRHYENCHFSGSQNMSNKSSHSYLILPILISLGLFIVWLIWGAIMWAPAVPADRSPGAVGDSYGVLTSFVTALSLVAIWFSLHYQRKDTNTQLQMLVQQLEEAQESKDALQQQAIATRRLSEITALQSKLVFFSQPNVLGTDLTADEICQIMYKHDVKMEVRRILSKMDELTGHRGNRIIDIRMGEFDVCRVWCADIPYPKIQLTPIEITNASVLLRIEFPAGYQYEKFRVTQKHPAELLEVPLGGAKRKLNESLSLHGEGVLCFNVDMGWGLMPHSKNYDISINSGTGFNKNYLAAN